MDEKPKTSTELIQAVTDTKQAKFLELYPHSRMISKTAEGMGIGRSTVFAWLNQDAVFRDALDALKRELDAQLIETYEKNIFDIALDTDVPPQSRILGSIFMLKGLVPSKYRDNVQPGISVGTINVTLGVPEPDYKDKPADYIDVEAKDVT